MTKHDKPHECSCKPAAGGPVALTVAQAAERLQVSEATVYRLLRLGLLPGGARVGMVWRIDADKLEAMFVAAHAS